MATKRVLIKEESEKAKKRRPEVKIEYEVKKIKPPPAKWEETWEKLAEMRAAGGAPVDEMGADCLAEKSSPAVYSYQTLIGLMLSSQTRDQMTEKAMAALKKHGLTVENIMKTPEEDIAKMVNCVSFYRRKAIYIKKTTELLATKYNGVPPNTLEETLEFPGVGPKMAHLYMQIAHGIVKGIGVDTHVHRISNRLRWVKTETPEETALEEWLPFEKWHVINKLMVGFGQTTCRPVGPKCDQCLLSNGLCPAARQFLPQARARTAAALKKEEEKPKVYAPVKDETGAANGQVTGVPQTEPELATK